MQVLINILVYQIISNICFFKIWHLLVFQFLIICVQYAIFFKWMEEMNYHLPYWVRDCYENHPDEYNDLIWEYGCVLFLQKIQILGKHFQNILD